MLEFEVTKISTGEKRKFDFSDLIGYEELSIALPEECDANDGVWIKFKDDNLENWKLSGNCGYRDGLPINPDLKIEVVNITNDNK